MEIPLIMKIESSRGEILNALQSIQKKYGLPAFILDGVISSVLSDIRAEEKIELINANNIMLNDTKEEIEKLRKEIKND